MPKIMIIDDDVEIIENIVAVLDEPGMEISTMDTTEGAVERLLSETPDLLILDVMFPENPAGGFDLAREIRQVEGIKTLPIILLTAINQELPMDFSSGDIDDEWMPVQNLLEKPIRMGELKEAVNSLLHRA